MSMSYKMTNAEEWWTAVDECWGDLLRIIGDQMLMDCPAYDTPGNAQTPMSGRTVEKELEHLRETRDGRIARYFHAAWGIASDSYAWSVPGWGVLCDLCSEEWCIREEPEETP
jgi:hypothetical protein